MVKKIHYCWFGGKKLPKDVVKCIKTWKKMLPDYEIIEWNESNFDVNMCKFVSDAYKHKKWAFVSDYVRIFALYNEGGIYFDTDVKILKDISHIVDKDMFLGYEDSGFVGTAVIGVKEKNNKYIKEILDYYNKQEEFNPEIMYNYANPLIITKILKKYDSIVDDKGIQIIDNNVYIYPRDYFYPLSYNYAEREYTENTCMVHLFSATWTSKGEKRTIGIYRKFGPDLGKSINGFIDGLGNCKYRIKGKFSAIYWSLRSWYSININRNKRVKLINEEIQKFEGDTIVICNPDVAIDNRYIAETVNNNILYLREQHTNKEANMIAKCICDNGKKNIIFNSYYDGWDMLINSLKQIERKNNIELIIHGSNAVLANTNNWQKVDKIIELYAKRKINKLDFFNQQLKSFFDNKGYKTQLLKRNIVIQNKEQYRNKTDRKYIKVGLYVQGHDVSQNIYNQMNAVSLIDDARLDFNPMNYEVATSARRFNINIAGDSKALTETELYERLAANDINLCIKLVDDDSLIPWQSLELGVPCLIGKSCKLFGNTELEKEIMVNDPEDIEEISNKIIYVINNKEKVLELYSKLK